VVAWGWDVATSCGADSSHYVVHWTVFMVVVVFASDDDHMTISVVNSGTDNGIECFQPSFPCLVLIEHITCSVGACLTAPHRRRNRAS
jgi:hypothetical protein